MLHINGFRYWVIRRPGNPSVSKVICFIGWQRHRLTYRPLTGLAALYEIGTVGDSRQMTAGTVLPARLSTCVKNAIWDEKVRVNELLTLDLNKQVIGAFTLETVAEVAGEKS